MEETTNPNAQPVSNAHARQTFWQIYFPLLLTILGIALIFFLIFTELSLFHLLKSAWSGTHKMAAGIHRMGHYMVNGWKKITARIT